MCVCVCAHARAQLRFGIKFKVREFSQSDVENTCYWCMHDTETRTNGLWCAFTWSIIVKAILIIRIRSSEPLSPSSIHEKRGKFVLRTRLLGRRGKFFQLWKLRSPFPPIRARTFNVQNSLLFVDHIVYETAINNKKKPLSYAPIRGRGELDDEMKLEERIRSSRVFSFDAERSKPFSRVGTGNKASA